MDHQCWLKFCKYGSHCNYHALLQQVDVGTISQNIGLYALIMCLLLVISIQRSILNQRKK